MPGGIFLGVCMQRSLLKFLGLLLFLGQFGLSACTPAPHLTEINDPFETKNRKVHQWNKNLDRAILKPLSQSSGTATNGAISGGISNFAGNIGMPGIILNDALQLNLPDFFNNTFRFVMNSTIGIGGLLDVASQNGLEKRGSDFGETLHVWGVPEGNFVELPFYSASTERDAVGIVVDFAIDPMNYLLPGKLRFLGPLSKVVNSIGNRIEFAGFVESVLYESEDSYAQGRLLYLQSRRKHLYGELTDAELEDPYAE